MVSSRFSSIPEAHRRLLRRDAAIAEADGPGTGRIGLDFPDILYRCLSDVAEIDREYLVDHLATDRLASFTTSHEHLRCAVMVYLIVIGLADQSSLPAKMKLCSRPEPASTSAKKIDAIKRYICNVGLIRARPRDHQEGTTALKYKYGLWLVAAVSLPAIALYFSSTIGGVSIAQMFSGLARPGTAGRCCWVSAPPP